MHSKLAIGVKAPDFSFPTPWDDAVNFYDAAGHHPAILIFLRYYGCPVCQMEMAKIKQDIELARQKDGRVFVVLQSAPGTIAAFGHGRFEGKETQLPAAFTVTADKVIHYAYYGKNIGDIPPLSAIISGL